jgi:hypothetical protein
MSYALLQAQSTITVKPKEKKPEQEPAVAQIEPVVEQPPVAPVKIAPKPPPIEAQIVETERPSKVKILPWVTLAGGVVATGIGVFFAVRTTAALKAQNDLEFDINTSKRKVNIPDEFTDNQRDIYINGITSTVLISAGISGIIASCIGLSPD